MHEGKTPSKTGWIHSRDAVCSYRMSSIGRLIIKMLYIGEGKGERGRRRRNTPGKTDEAEREREGQEEGGRVTLHVMGAVL